MRESKALFARGTWRYMLLMLALAAPLGSQAATVNGSLTVGGSYRSLLAEIGGRISLDTIVADGYGTSGDFLTTVGDGDTGIANNDLVYPGVVVDPLFNIGGWEIALSSSVIDYEDADYLFLSGTGTVRCIDLELCAGFSDTAMSWNLSAQAAGGTYSMVVTTVPVPAAVWLFGTGLIGLAGVARRKRG